MQPLLMGYITPVSVLLPGWMSAVEMAFSESSDENIVENGGIHALDIETP